jgi:hypothetical protein
MSEYPRVHDCLYNWCPRRRPECERCDRIMAVMTLKSKETNDFIDEFERTASDWTTVTSHDGANK